MNSRCRSPVRDAMLAAHPVLSPCPPRARRKRSPAVVHPFAEQVAFSFPARLGHKRARRTPHLEGHPTSSRPTGTLFVWDMFGNVGADNTRSR